MAPNVDSEKKHNPDLHVFLEKCREYKIDKTKIQTMSFVALKEMQAKSLSSEDFVRPYLTLKDKELSVGFCHDTLIFDFCNQHDHVLSVHSYLSMFTH